MHQNIWFLSLAFILVVLLSAMSFGQLVQFRQPLVITAFGAPDQIDTLWCGVHGDGPGGIVDNTYAADVDDQLYFPPWIEMPNPPDPPEFKLYTKFIQIPKRTVGIGSTGIKPADYRDYRNPAQVDTFHISVYGDASDSAWVARGPITISWPGTLSNYATIWELKRRVGVAGSNYVTVVPNMATSAGTYIDENNDPVTGPLNAQRYLIIKTGAFAPSPGPFCIPAQTTLALGNVSSNVTTSTIVINNTGAENALVISGVTPPAGFTAVMSNNTIAPLSSQTLTVTFDATALAAGAYSGNIVISHNGVAPTVAPTNIAVSATVIAPEIIASPSSIDFGTISYPLSRTLTVAVTNISPLRPLNISSIVSTNTAFTISQSAPLIVAPSGSQTLDVTFTTQLAGGIESGVLVIAGDDSASVALSGTSQVQGGKLMLDAPAISVLDNSYKADGYYSATIGLHEYTGAPLKSFQFLLKTNGKVIMHKLAKAVRDSNWILSTKVIRGTVLPDGSSIDSTYVVLWASGANTLDTTGIATAPIPLLTFGYDVVNITTDSDSTSCELKNILASTNIFTDAKLNTSAVEAVTINNRINRGDVNKDDRVDILDLLMIVDHITTKAPLTGDAFKSADVAPWPNGDGAVNVIDLAQLQSIILNNQYPDGSPLLQIAPTPVTRGLAKASINLQFYITTHEIAIELHNTTLFRGVQVKFTGIQSATTNSGADLTGTAYGFKDSILTVLIKRAEPLPAGNYIIARIPVNCSPTHVEIVPGIIVAGDDLKPAIYEESIIYAPVTGIADDERLNLAPKEFSLSQNYPNPFNPTTTIKYAVKEQSQVRIALYNMLGQEIVVLVHSKLPAGFHSIEWNGTDSNGKAISTGTYIYRMTAGNFVETKKMMFLK